VIVEAVQALRDKSLRTGQENELHRGNTYLVWNHGEAFVESARAQPNEIKHPPMNEFTNILSILMRAFLAPMREISSVVWAGVKASMIKAQSLFFTRKGLERLQLSIAREIERMQN
jgi:hypothetical protein